MPLLAPLFLRRLRLGPRPAGAAAFRAAPLAGLLAFFAGCQMLPEPRPDPTRYFVLSTPDAVEESLVVDRSGPTVGLRPIELPGYLRHTRSLVVAGNTHEIAFRDHERWAEPLEAGLERVLRHGLAESERVGRVVTFPFELDAPRDFDIRMRIRHCEGVDGPEGRHARFVASYEITRAGTAGEIVKQGLYQAPRAEWDGESASLAAHLSEAALGAGRTIAAELP